jgi:hypothetical protein
MLEEPTIERGGQRLAERGLRRLPNGDRFHAALSSNHKIRNCVALGASEQQVIGINRVRENI